MAPTMGTRRGTSATAASSAGRCADSEAVVLGDLDGDGDLDAFVVPILSNQTGVDQRVAE